VPSCTAFRIVRVFDESEQLEAGELLGISVLDHVIVAGRGVVSLRAKQLL